MSGFSVEQLQALALMFLKLQAQAIDVGLVFFALYCLLIGHLILRSDFLPRILGVPMVFAGIGWLTLLWPPLASSLVPGSMEWGSRERSRAGTAERSAQEVGAVRNRY